MLRTRGWPLFVPAVLWFVIAGAVLVYTSTDLDAWRSIDRRGQSFEGAKTCRRCHPKQFESWHSSYHRTMTQSAGSDTITAPFSGEYIDYLGFRTIMDRRDDGSFRMSVYSTGSAEFESGADSRETPIESYSISMTVGSHRYQQYVAKIDRGGGPMEAWRLPMVWHHEEHRWLPTNAAFVEPEGRQGSLPDFMRHFTRWNDNCIFCHNTDLSPGLDSKQKFQTHVGELGIACEACHGPAQAHLDRHQNPARRLLAGKQNDGSITHPGRLDPAKESAICGRCHGQRIGHDIETIMHRGDQFIPGESLSEVSRPIFRDSQLEGLPKDSFASRFWPDGTPRLSAYEYQGLLLSPCFGRGEAGSLGCNHCHDMHGQKPDKQIRRGRERGRSCASCHAKSTLSQAPPGGIFSGHGGHATIAVEVDCLDCHMPRITYGLLEGMISHRITSPNPARWLGRKDQPDACTQCHVNESRTWATQNMERLGLSQWRKLLGQQDSEDAPRQAGETESWASRVVLDLYGGDALQRNLAADALGYEKSAGSLEWKMAVLVEALEDEYPSVRWFAWRSLRGLARRSQNSSVLNLINSYDHLADPAERMPIGQELRQLLGPGPFGGNLQRVSFLQQSRDDQEIWIGE